MHGKLRLTSLAAAVVVACSTTSAFATNGMLMEGYGPESTAMGGTAMAFDNGAAKVFGAGASRFGLDRPLPPKQLQRRIDEQFEAHCQAMPREMMNGMVEAQRLRDAALAQAALKAYQETGGPVVVITGNGHARKDWGALALLHMAAPDLTLLSVGFLETEEEADSDSQIPPYDLWVYTDPAPREDPCKAFQ